ncbi:MAG: RnfABCDGE type electron transport complex subunit B [Lachnospiraceae bacterium]|nr:RnfABCDGE type electron transport complex subunit B [Lachnospiraceae bacterium]
MVTGVLLSVLIVAGVGILIGLFLGIASNKLHVEVDEKEVAVLGALPGNNCGGCGFPGCSGLAAAIAKGEAPVGQCPVGGEPVAAVIAGIMGVEAGSGEKMVAFVHCRGTAENAEVKYEYYGASDCRVIDQVPGGGPKVCEFGCLGGGTCVNVCPFDAIHVVDGVAVVDKDACKACGKCVVICPRHLIDLVPYKATQSVTCMSKAKGPVVMKACKTGCIGCGICAKNCPAGAITVEDNVARIDQEKCEHCGLCAEKCPKKAIVTIA